MKIIVAAGGSGGHIFPAVALANELEKHGHINIVFAASRRTIDKKILKDSKYRKILFTRNPMPYRLSVRWIPFVIKAILDIIMSLVVLLVVRPKVVVGFGGYTSGAIVVMACIMGIKTIIHEQNLVPGRANRILERYVDVVAGSFDSTKKFFNNPRVVITGNPLRDPMLSDEREKILERFGLEKAKFTILIMGGSQGASSLNRLASNAIIQLDRNVIDNIQVIHIAGPKDVVTVFRQYRDSGVSCKAFPFVDNIYDAYKCCDLAISRAGAAAMFELSLYAIPMILIPFPFKQNDQRFNAAYFSERGAAIYVEEDNIDSDELKRLIEDLIGDAGKLKCLSDAARKLSQPDAAKRLAEEVLKLA